MDKNAKSKGITGQFQIIKKYFLVLAIFLFGVALHGQVVKVASLQAGTDHFAQGNPGLEKNFELFASLAKKAAKEKPDIIVFPEYAISGWGYPPKEVMNSLGEPIPGTGYWFQKYVQLAREIETPILGWLVDQEDGALYNCSFLLDENGAFVGKYQKVQVNLGEQTWWGWSQGKSFEPIEFKGVKYGISICADMWFPETVRCEELLGADILLHQSIGDDMQHLIPTRALDSNIPIVMTIFKGGSYAYDGHGKLYKKLPSEKAMWTMFEVDLFQDQMTGKYGGWYPKKGRKNLRNVEAYQVLTDASTRPPWTEVFVDENGNAQTREQLLERFQGIYDQRDPKTKSLRTTTLWSPYLEWEVPNPEYKGNPFDVVAEVTFRNERTQKGHTTEMFFAGGHTWKFRFTGTETGTWSFKSKSSIPALDGIIGQIKVVANPNPEAQGFLKKFEDKWGWQGTEKVFVPQLYMLDYALGSRTPKVYYDHPDIIDAKIQEFIGEHGFLGFHVPVIGGRWFDLDQSSDQVMPNAENPDIRTFEALESLIVKTHKAGGMVHIWPWGDESRGQTPLRLKGGMGGPEDRRLQRYIAARLGPIPGWSFGYGFDLDEWVTADQLRDWRNRMHDHMGWPHFMGGRPIGPNKGLDHSKDAQWNRGLDYSGYEHHRPTYEVYLASLEALPGQPVMSEDRFRYRNRPDYKWKDYDEEKIRKGLYQSTMAGGVANIWGISPEINEGGKFVHKNWVKTYAIFFDQKNRFLKDMVPTSKFSPDNRAQVLYSQKNRSLVIYSEGTQNISVDLSDLSSPLKVIAVNAKREYAEIDLGILEAKIQTISLPVVSDWVLAIGNF